MQYFTIKRGIIPQNFSSIDGAVSEELWNKQIYRQTDSLTSYCFRGRYSVNLNLFEYKIE